MQAANQLSEHGRATGAPNPFRVQVLLMNLRKLLSALIALGTMLPAIAALAALTEPAPVERHILSRPQSDLVGETRMVTVDDAEQTLLDIAREQGIGQEEILNANPGVDRWLPRVGSEIIIPGKRLLPEGVRSGIVINLPEYRLYYFPQPAKKKAGARETKKSGPREAKKIGPSEARKTGPSEVLTFPISVGRMDWQTPLGLTHVASKQKNPSWIPPASIRAEHAADGEELPQVVPPGPENPLGAYALRLGIAGYLIHGTDKQFGVGMRVTHGCMRLLPEHIEALFQLAPVGTPVRLMNQPIKLGWGPDGLYLEVHPPLEEDENTPEILIDQTLAAIHEKLASRPDLEVDELAAATAIVDKSGIPVQVTREQK
jgi:L,D-transpeptidase ErfK/SrfK